MPPRDFGGGLETLAALISQFKHLLTSCSRTWAFQTRHLAGDMAADSKTNKFHHDQNFLEQA